MRAPRGKETCGLWRDENKLPYSCTRSVKVFSVFEPQGCGTRQRDSSDVAGAEQILSYFAMLSMEVQINM